MSIWQQYMGDIWVPSAPSGEAGIKLKDDLKTLRDYAPKSSFSETTNPGPTNDETEGWQRGSHWYNSNFWIEHWQYTAGRETLHAHPSAVASYTENTNGTLTVTLHSAAGFIELTTYYAATSGGGVAGYEEYRQIKNGSSGSPIKLSKTEYTSNTDANGVTIYLISKRTVYRSAASGGSDGVDTTYSYTFGSTNQPEQIVTTLPVVPDEQNGPGGSGAQTVDKFDSFGYRTSHTDERGFVTTFEYDIVTGAITRQTQDPTTTSPAYTGLNLVTDFEVDDLGRNTEVRYPEHYAIVGGNAVLVRTAQWTVYRDDIDEVRSAAGFIASGGTTLVNPVSISVRDEAGRQIKAITAVTSDTTQRLQANATYPESTWVRLSESSYDDQGYQTSSRVYHAFGPAWSSLTLDEWDELTLDQWESMELNASDNYAETTYGYDPATGRQIKTRSPGGTITRTVFDVRGLAVSTWVGTDDTGATASNPAGSGSPNNMVKVSQNQYDGGADGDDGNLSQIKLLVDGNSSNDRTTNYLYDWRNRQEYIAGEVDFFQQNFYDNLNHVTKVERRNSTLTGNLIARSETKFDNQGRAYQTIRYAVNPIDGSVGNALIDNTWYDAAGNVLKSQPAGSSAFTKMVYDAIGRTTATYVGFYGGSGDDDPASLADNYIFEQSQSIYDAASNVLQTTSLQRFHSNTTATGALIAPTTSGYNARPTYTALYHDGIGRQIAGANYGTNDNSAFSRPSTVPTRSDDVLVTTTDFDSEGMPYQTTDPAGTITQQVFDRAGRRVALIENVQGTTGDDKNRTTVWSYTPDGQIETLTALNSTTGDQTTAYGFGVTTTGSTLCSNDLLHTETYPDGGVVTHEYNRQGERIKTTDQNGTVHEFDRDKLGRQTDDRVTAVGSGIDDAVLRIGIAYEVRGMVETITSYDAATSGDVVNQVKNLYNTFSQLASQAQEHDGPVSGTTPNVQYAYASGSANTIRPTSVTYPNGRVLTYGYGSGGSFADKLSRIETLTFDGIAVAQYGYLGVGSFVQVDYLQPAVRYDLATGSGANPYAGLDRFGRVIDLLWRKYSTTAADLEHLQYGYDRASNRVWRKNLVSAGLSAPVYLDELYTYDGLYQLQDMKRGQLTGSPPSGIAGLKFQQQWGLDPTGNWKNFREDTTGGGSWSLNQTRTANQVNEITNIGATTGANWIDPVYDAAGNMITMPQPAAPTNNYTAIYDAWNRLVKVLDGATIVDQYAYDGQTWRTTSGSASGTRHFYYSAGWQVFEERLGTSPSTASADRQFVWGLRYIDDLVRRDRSTTGMLNEHLYAMQDAIWNVVSICNASAIVKERITYTSYGLPTFADDSFASLSSTSSCEWERLFGAYVHIDGINLYLARFRHLHPSLGLWITRDPYGAVTRVYSYCYVMGNPCLFVDPFGLQLIGPGLLPKPTTRPSLKRSATRSSRFSRRGGPDWDIEGIWDGSWEDYKLPPEEPDPAPTPQPEEQFDRSLLPKEGSLKPANPNDPCPECDDRVRKCTEKYDYPKCPGIVDFTSPRTVSQQFIDAALAGRASAMFLRCKVVAQKLNIDDKICPKNSKGLPNVRDLHCDFLVFKGMGMSPVKAQVTVFQCYCCGVLPEPTTYTLPYGTRDGQGAPHYSDKGRGAPDL